MRTAQEIYDAAEQKNIAEKAKVKAELELRKEAFLKTNVVDDCMELISAKMEKDLAPFEFYYPTPIAKDLNGILIEELQKHLEKLGYYARLAWDADKLGLYISFYTGTFVKKQPFFKKCWKLIKS